VKRFNPAALVEHFVAGVNDAGGMWVCPSGKPFTDLAAALQPWAAKVSFGTPGPLERCSLLGRRWFAYCGGAPRDAWKAAAWLGEGAPEEPRRPPAPREVQESAAKARRSEEAKARERDAERRKREEQAVPAPPEVRAKLSALFEQPGSQTRVKSAQEQAEELERMVGE
jgi:hypothetical protein